MDTNLIEKLVNRLMYQVVSNNIQIEHVNGILDQTTKSLVSAIDIATQRDLLGYTVPLNGDEKGYAKFYLYNQFGSFVEFIESQAEMHQIHIAISEEEVAESMAFVKSTLPEEYLENSETKIA